MTSALARAFSMTKTKSPLYIDDVFDALFFLFPLKEDPDATGKPDTIYTSEQLDKGVSSSLLALACAALVRRLTGVSGVRSRLARGSRRQRRWDILFGFGSRFMTAMIFTNFEDRFLTAADEESCAYARVLGFCSYVSLI